jgi:ferrous iron transport protein B
MSDTAYSPRVALVGNPNCGKTALFNSLTGARQKVANYPGVTVERKMGQLTTPGGRRAYILDLPGTYSLRARSPDEAVTRDIVLGRRAGEEPPDVIVCVADATNLRLVLRLVLELKRIGRPLVLALNMFDIAQRQGIDIDIEGMSSALGIPVVTTVAVRKRGLESILAQIDMLAPDEPDSRACGEWHEPNASEIRAAHRSVERILKQFVKPPARPDTWTARIDAVLLHPVFGTLILLGVLFLMFQAVFSWATPVQNLIDAGFSVLSGGVKAVMPDGLVRSLITDGLIAGVGSVVVFLPQILILFFFIILLEDFGYMARAAFLMDKMMGAANLHGRAFIPLLSSFACAIPGIMSARVIDNRRDRIATILAAPLTTCSARIPVYTLVISAFIPNRQVLGFASLQGLVMFGLYATGIIGALGVAFVLRRIFWRSAVEPFLLEMPSYKMPDPMSVLRGVLTRAQIFLKRAGTIILSMMIIIWALTSFPASPPGAVGPAVDYSFAGMIGHFIQPVLAPIGFSWEMSVALIPGMAAREVVVAVLGTIYAIGGHGNSGSLAATLTHHWSIATALAFLAWYVFAPQCASTLVVVKRETNSWFWPIVMFSYMLALAYGAAFIVYHAATALGL